MSLLAEVWPRCNRSVGPLFKQLSHDNLRHGA